MAGLAATMGVTLQQTTIAGTPVWIGSNAQYSAAALRAGQDVVDVETLGSPDVARAVVAALIAANA
jgi:hypothetical protein